MMETTTVLAAAFLLSMGVVAIVLGAVGGYFSSRRRGPRTVALVVVGVASLAATYLVLADHTAQEAWEGLFWPLIYLTSGVLAGVGAGAGLLYVLAQGR